MFETKKLQLEADKRALAAAKESYAKYKLAAIRAKNNGLQTINLAKAEELNKLIDIIERRCKVLTK